ncbi:MAG: GNAT family N-acetyltransferase [Pseudorhodobacter sp.]
MVTIQRGLPEALRPRAVGIYWQAFGSKLGRIMGPQDRACRFLTRAIRADHAFIALSERGELLGLAGFKSPQGSLAGGSPADLRAVYGIPGSIWRAGLLRLLNHEVDNHHFLLDGICVAPEERGHGIGTALLEAIFEEGRSRGYDAIRLDVIDTNHRARALYERLGFTVHRHDHAGFLGRAFGVGGSHVMVRPL